MQKHFSQTILGPLYLAALTARNTWWRIRRPLLMGVRILVVQEGQILLVRHRAGKTPWSLPGGGVEKGEQLAAAAIRECYEEARVNVQIEQLLGTYDSFAFGITNFIAVFHARPLGALQPLRSFEIAEARYFPFDALPANMEKGSIQRLKELRAGKYGLFGKW